MSAGDSRFTIPCLVFAACFANISCSTITNNANQSREQRPQANDLITGTGAMAMGVFRSTALSAIRQPVTTARLGVAVLWHRPREVLNANIPIEFAFSPPPEEVPGSAEFEKLLDQNGMPKAESGTLKWLVDGDGFFPEFDRELAAAKTSVDVQVFIFDNDDIGARYADRLREKAASVPVRVMFDDLGSSFAHTSAPETPAPTGFTPPVDMFRYLRRDSDIRVRRTLNPWLVCDHTKLLVFDKKIAMLGGMNIGREYYSEWHDLMVRVDGPIVSSLSREFSRAWRKAGPYGDLALFRKPAAANSKKPIIGGIPIRILRTDPAEGRYDILETTLLAIRAARTRIWLQNPYLAHDDITLALESAARRGVDVRIILPARGDSTIMDIGNLSSARGLIQAGAKLYRYPRMTHMKVMICDQWASVGSANLDTLSVRINRELNLSFNDRATIDSLIKAVFTPDFRISERMKLSDTNSIFAPFAEALADQL